MNQLLELLKVKALAKIIMAKKPIAMNEQYDRLSPGDKNTLRRIRKN